MIRAESDSQPDNGSAEIGNVRKGIVLRSDGPVDRLLLY